MNLLHGWSRRVALRHSREQKVGVADHRREDVVEVVGDAPRELSHRLHLLRVPELFLQHDALGHVGLDAVDVDEPVGLETRRQTAAVPAPDPL